MKFSVIIPTFNRRLLLAKTLPTVLAQEFPPDDFEVILVVDGSTDGTYNFIHSVQSAPNLLVLEQPHQGQASARNSGLHKARGEWVLFLDDDMICPKTLLLEHAAAHIVDDPIVVVGPVLLSPESAAGLASDIRGTATEAWMDRFGNERYLSRYQDIIVGANVSVPRRVLVEVGGYDERLRTAWEDYDLAFRLAKRGFPFRQCTAATAYEFYTKSIRQVVFDDAVNSGKNQFLLCRLHPEFRPLSVFRHLGSASALKRIVLRIVVSAPFSPAWLLHPACSLADRFRKIAWIRRAGLKLLRAQIFIQIIRGGIAAIGSWQAAIEEFGRRLAVLLYHRIGGPQPHLWPISTVSPARFARHIKWLVRHGYSGICPSDWLDLVTKGKPLPRKAILVTFDDAYAELGEFALPLLAQQGYGAGVYAVTSLLGKTNVWDEKQGYSTLHLMTAKEVRHWSQKGIEFGAHSRTHPDLTKLTSEELKEEIEGSGQDLEAIIGHPIASFAYPYGLYDDASSDQTRRSYRMAFTLMRGVNNLQTDLHQLKRTPVDPRDSALDIFLRARWGWSPWRAIMNRIRRQLHRDPLRPP